MIRNLFRILIIVLVAATAYAAWHFYFNKGTVRITITQEQIDEALERKFPKESTYVKVIKVHYENPVVEMIPGQDRVRISLDVRAEVGLSGILTKSYNGHATIATSLGYNPSSHRFSLVDPAVETLDLPGLSKSHLKSLGEGLNLAAVLWFDDIPVYRIKERDLKTKVTRHVLRNVEIRNDRIIATLGLPEDENTNSNNTL